MSHAVTLFLKIFQYSRDKYNFIKKVLQDRCFLVNVAEFLNFLKNICQRLLLLDATWTR